MLADLRESGAIEAHSDVVAVLYGEEIYDRYTTQSGCRGVSTLRVNSAWWAR
jgi:replicative DNA helicase